MTTQPAPSVREKLKNAHCGMCVENNCEGLHEEEIDAIIAVVVEEAEGMKRPIDNMKFLGDEGQQIEVQRDMGYNDALDKLITRLKGKYEK